MKTQFLPFAVTALLICSCNTTGERWSTEKAGEWFDAQPWLAGCNYIPANAVNQIEMWQSETFDANAIDQELLWAEELGFNTLRTFLSSLAYYADPDGFKVRLDTFLKICDKHGIRPLLVFFDDCWNADSSSGPQPEPKAGIHNSGWVQDPNAQHRRDTSSLDQYMKVYLQDILLCFKNDDRILAWDLYNEPTNKGQSDSPALVAKVFGWAREVKTSQPLTVGVWNDNKEVNELALANSDIISFHNYQNAESVRTTIDSLRQYGRPLMCTEYMARPESRLQEVMPVLKENQVAAYNWGFVSGKTNTIFRWNTPLPDVAEPEIWFCDIFRKDHSPFDPEEIELIKELTR